MKQLSERELSSLVESAISSSEHFTDSKLQRERTDVHQYYEGELPKPLHKGDSKYVSRDVFDAVDSARSLILEAFSGHHRIVKFRPEANGSVEDANNASDYCRYAFFRDNRGEEIMYDATTDGLMARYAVAHVYPDESVETEQYEFEGLTRDEYDAFLVSAETDEYEVLEEDWKNGLVTGKVEFTKRRKRVHVESVPPENFLVSARTSNIHEAKFCALRDTKTISELRSLGFDPKKIDRIGESATSNNSEFDYERQQRFEAIGEVSMTDDEWQESVREVDVYECYMLVDMDGSGIAKLWKIVYCGTELLEKEQVNRRPFETYVPIPRPHTFFGENFAKNVVPVQNARTTLVRTIINHGLITNNPRQKVLNGTLSNPQELMDNRLGGIVNVRRMDGIMPVDQQPLNPFVFNTIQLVDEDKDEVTGISRLSQGLNKDAISSQNSEGMVEKMVQASQTRTRVMARRFGQFLTGIFLLIYNTAVEHLDTAEFEDILGNWKEVDVAAWKERKAASVELALSKSEREAEAAKHLEVDAYLSQDPSLANQYGPQQRYDNLIAAFEARGIDNIGSIFLSPEEAPEPQPDPAQEAKLDQIKAQNELTRAQAQAAIMKADNDKMRLQIELKKLEQGASETRSDQLLETAKFAHEKAMNIREMENAEEQANKGEASASFAPEA